jgi:putative (di)nucleoside polyphosphate hydrolase
MSKVDKLPYRPCVGIMLTDGRGRVFVGRRLDTPDAWQMPQGGIDDGESPRQAALRELLEEIGTNAAEIVGETEGWLRYDLPAHLIGKVWKGKYRGQKQKWVLARFTGTDADIDLATDHPEFDAWQWVEPGQLVERIVPFKREIYEAVVAEFQPLLAPRITQK